MWWSDGLIGGLIGGFIDWWIATFSGLIVWVIDCLVD